MKRTKQTMIRRHISWYAVVALVFSVAANIIKHNHKMLGKALITHEQGLYLLNQTVIERNFSGTGQCQNCHWLNNV
jgi:hypothetical protein